MYIHHWTKQCTSIFAFQKKRNCWKEEGDTQLWNLKITMQSVLRVFWIKLQNLSMKPTKNKRACIRGSMRIFFKILELKQLNPPPRQSSKYAHIEELAKLPNRWVLCCFTLLKFCWWVSKLNSKSTPNTWNVAEGHFW